MEEEDSDSDLWLEVHYTSAIIHAYFYSGDTLWFWHDLAGCVICSAGDKCKRTWVLLVVCSCKKVSNVMSLKLLLHDLEALCNVLPTITMYVMT